MNLARVSNNGEIVVQNPNVSAIGEAQTAVDGSDYSEDEILADVMNLRYGSAMENALMIVS